MNTRRSLLLPLALLLFAADSALLAQSPGRVQFAGLPHSSLGAADVSVQGGVLTVANIGSSGQDGVSIALGQAMGLQMNMQQLQLTTPTDAGASVKFTVKGMVSGVPTTIGVLTENVLNDRVQFNMDFGGVHSTGMFITLLQGDHVVYQTHASTPLSVKSLPASGPTSCPDGFTLKTIYHSSIEFVCEGDKVDKQIVTLAENICVLLNGSEYNVNTVQFERDGSGDPISYLTAMELTGNLAPASVPTVKVSGEALQFGKLTYTALGQATLNAGSGLELDNLGSSGQDGGDVGWNPKPKKSKASLQIQGGLGGSSPVGAFVEHTVTGSAGGLPDQTLVTQRTEITPSGMDITADFSGLGASSSLVVLKLDGTVVGMGSGNTGPVEICNGCGGPFPYVKYEVENDGDGFITGHGIDCIFPDTGFFSAAVLGPAPILANELAFGPENAALIPDALTHYTITGAGLGPITITNASTADAPGQFTQVGNGLDGTVGIPLIDASGSLVPGTVFTLAMTNAKPASICLLCVSAASTPLPFKGGTLYAFPFLFTVTTLTNQGSLAVPIAVPNIVIPHGLAVYFQFAVADAAAANGVSLTAGLKGTF